MDHSPHKGPQCWSEVFFYLLKCLSLSFVFSYIHILQGSVEMNLGGGII